MACYRGFTTDSNFSIWTQNLLVSQWLTLPFLPLILSLQDGGWEDWKEDFEICGQNHEIQILPEGSREWVHKKEVWGDVQHASAAHCGGARAVRDPGHQCATTSNRQDMVRRKNHINYVHYSLLKCVFNKSILSLKESRDPGCCDMLMMASSLFRYSFSVPPKLDLHVRPKLGEREVTFCHVTEWIEKKLQDEFQVKEKMEKTGKFCQLSCLF